MGIFGVFSPPSTSEAGEGTSSSGKPTTVDGSTFLSLKSTAVAVMVPITKVIA